MGRFDNQVVWITGASSGIGEALAYEMGRQGARLILSSNEPGDLARVRGVCRERGFEAEEVFVDLADSDGMETRAAEALGFWGRIDVLVNNGGISQRSLAKDTGLDVDVRLMEIDYFGHVALTKAVLPSMIRKRSGRIVVTTSVAGLMGVPFRSGYCAAKHALHGYFESLRAEVWRDNVRVTLIAPAAVNTGIAESALTENGGRFARPDPLIRGGISPEACARAIVRAVAKGIDLAVIGKGKGKMGAYLKRFLPGLYSRAIRKQKLVDI